MKAIKGAVDLAQCPNYPKTCRCQPKCIRCGYGPHFAIHGPHYGGLAGSKPYGHEYKPPEADDRRL